MNTLAEIAEQISQALPPESCKIVPLDNGDSYLRVLPESFSEVCGLLRAEPFEFDFLRMITGLDLGDTLGVVYHFYAYKTETPLTLRVEIPKDNPSIPSVMDIWPAAEWHERETYDLMGVIFTGNKDLHRILLPEDWEGHPLRKDYVSPSEYHGISNV